MGWGTPGTRDLPRQAFTDGRKILIRAGEAAHMARWLRIRQGEAGRGCGYTPGGPPAADPAMPESARGEVTMLLRRLADGHADARGPLADLVYRELREMAARQLRGMRGATMQPTALVHEAWLKLAAHDDFVSRSHFLGVAGKAMRCVLVDHVRHARALKRGGQIGRQELDDAVAFFESGEVDLIDLDEALGELERDDPELARWVDMRFFAGMTNVEIAALEGCSESTIERGWRAARARLAQRMQGWAGS